MSIQLITVSAAFDSILPRDSIVNTMYFEDLGTADWQGNCSDIAALFDDNWYSSSSPQLVVKRYEVEAVGAHYPLTTVVRNEGQAASSGWPRELAICLSYYHDRPLPRQRGRMYLSINGTGQGASSARPSSGLMQKVLDLAQGLADIGGADVSWNQFSQVDQTGREVTHAWVDDEWDTMRSRGLRATDRQVVATGS